MHQIFAQILTQSSIQILFPKNATINKKLVTQGYQGTVIKGLIFSKSAFTHIKINTLNQTNATTRLQVNEN